VTVSDAEIGCVVLAAGESSRLGYPKALIEIDGETLISWITKRLVGLGLNPVIVTRSELYDRVKDSVRDLDIIVNDSPEAGRTGSVKEGLKFLKMKKGGESRVLIVPVDRPGFSKTTVELLMSELSTTCPTFEGRGGHPLMLSIEDCNAILEASSDVPLNRVVEPLRMPVNDRYLHLNIDTINDVDEFLRVVKFL